MGLNGLNSLLIFQPKKKGVWLKAHTNVNLNNFGVDLPSQQPWIALQINTPFLGEVLHIGGGHVCMAICTCRAVGMWSLHCSDSYFSRLRSRAEKRQGI